MELNLEKFPEESTDLSTSITSTVNLSEESHQLNKSMNNSTIE